MGTCNRCRPPGVQRARPMLIKTRVRHPQLRNHRPEALPRRRDFIRAAAGAGRGRCRRARRAPRSCPPPVSRHRTGRSSRASKKSPLSVDPAKEKLNTWEQITTYNNFYEFGTDKDSPSLTAGRLKTEPWTREIEGECAKKGNYHLETCSRARRSRSASTVCAASKRWSMVIPWVGFPLAELIKTRRADVEGEVRRVHDARRSRPDARRAVAGAATGPTSKGCGWTKRCTR